MTEDADITTSLRPGNALRLGVAQIGATQDVATNLQRVTDVLRDEAAYTDLIVMPETILSGYMYESRDEAYVHALEIDGSELGAVKDACATLGVHVVLGFLERDRSGGVYNSAALVDDTGAIAGHYRKTHLPCLGVDRFVDPGGEAPPVVTTKHGRIGIAICYDLRFPETARALALAGADLIAQPSTWPHEAAMLADHFVPVRACENRVFVAVANRPDRERGVGFMGRSQVAAPTGERLIEAGTDDEQVLSVVVDLGQARDKRIVNKPGEYQVSLFEDRRPELYTRITQPIDSVHEEQ
jgi:5-aminopentanamidase